MIIRLMSNVGSSSILSFGILLTPSLLLSPFIRERIEASMTLHMLVEFPLLFCFGWTIVSRFAGTFLVRFWIYICSYIDNRGWFGATFFTCTTFLWMIPSFLDESLMSPGMAAFKYCSWCISGALFKYSWHKMDPEIRYFVMGNVIWMTATAGLLYIDSPLQLCVNYLPDDQKFAGLGLICLALLLGVITIRNGHRNSFVVSNEE